MIEHWLAPVKKLQELGFGRLSRLELQLERLRCERDPAGIPALKVLLVKEQMMKMEFDADEVIWSLK